MATLVHTPISAPSLRAARTTQLLGTLTVALFGLQATLAFLQPINWDEFRFLSDIHLLARGELEAAVLTFHAHFFRWLLWLPGNEVDQVIAGRVAMLALEAGTAAMIYRCARRFTSADAALLAVLCYLSTDYVIRHGASFRFDPPSIFLLMAALTLLSTARLRLAVTAAVGALVALAAMITIKAVFLLPTLAAVAWWRLTQAADRRSAMLSLVGGAAAGAAALLFLYAFHLAHIAPAALDSSQAFVSSSMSKTLGHARILPQGIWLLRSLLESPVNWLLILGGAGLAIRACFASASARTEVIAIAAFGLPLLTLLFYRNAFPYYYAFMLAPASLLAAIAAEQIRGRSRIVLIALALVVCGAVHGLRAVTPVLAAQRTTLDAVHAMFPEPVSYIDGYSMTGAHRKRGIFMSTWGTEVYREAGRPIMRDLLLGERPAFVLINSPILHTALTGQGADYRLLPNDARTLRASFIPHWGPVWVAGKQLIATANSGRFELLVAGRYTVEADAPVRLDGALRLPGSVVTLAVGWHRLSADGETPVTLRWGAGLARPATPPPNGALFSDF